MSSLVFADHAGRSESRTPEGCLRITVPVRWRRRGGRKEIVLPERNGDEGPTAATGALSVSVIRAITWTHLLDSGKFRSVEELASRLRLEVSFVRRVMKLASLAPDIVYGILDGREPEGLTVGLLRKGVPLSWEEQRRTLGFHQSGGPVPAPRR